MHDEELRTISVGSGVSHSNSATDVFTSKRFVVEFITWSTGAGTSRITTLNHETIKNAMEDGVVIEVVFG